MKTLHSVKTMPTDNDIQSPDLGPCPVCSQLHPSGTFKTHPMEKLPLRLYRVQSDRINHGDFATLEMARAGACGFNAVILTREQNPKLSAASADQ